MKQDAWDDKVASAICRGLCRAMGVAYIEKGVVNVADVKPVKKIIDPDDIYLTVRVLDHLADQAIIDINKLGFACQRLELA